MEDRSGSILVIGIGNTLRGDDGIGHLCARAIEEAADLRAIEVHRVHQLAPELAETCASFGHVFLIDASENGSREGSVACTPVGPPGSSTGSLGHHFDPSMLLYMTTALYGHSPNMYLITVTCFNFELCDTISQPVLGAVNSVLALLRNFLSQGMATPCMNTQL